MLWQPRCCNESYHRRDVRSRRPRFRTRLDLLADVVVLAEHAAQVAVAEEDRARPVPAAQTVFFAEMREPARDDCVAAYSHLCEDEAEATMKLTGG
jgi:hypothetical protein